MSLVIDEKLLSDIVEANEVQKEWKNTYETHRKSFFSGITKYFESNPHLLPIKTIELPLDFFAQIGMTRLEWAIDRFTGWKVLSVEEREKTVVFIFQRSPEYMPYTYEGESYIGSRQIAESNPEVDWETLEIERPGLTEKITDTVITFKLNDDKLAALMETDPEVVSVIQRHVKYKAPIQKVSAKLKKVEDE